MRRRVARSFKTSFVCLKANAAEVFFASLLAAETEGDLEDDVFVLELGIGVGLFARYFLDNVRDLCWRNKKDYYDRLCYIAADKSERMLNDMVQHGVLANHPGRYRIRQIDALKPDEALPYDACVRDEEALKELLPQPQGPAAAGRFSQLFARLLARRRARIRW